MQRKDLMTCELRAKLLYLSSFSFLSSTFLTALFENSFNTGSSLPCFLLLLFVRIWFGILLLFCILHSLRAIFFF